MKKLFNKKFALILGSTITLLLVLTVAMIFLTKENTKSFSRSGYIIASSKENSTKYYFDEGTNYKTNINSELVFTDTTGKKINVETDNFLHYVDGGIKFLKNGVIMDLDSVSETIVPYYNITNKSLLEYSKKSYYIETLDKTLAFNNIIGRISENKYIVAGVNIKLQLAGNDNIIEGDYFEITFIEDGIIKVENQEVSYQTTAENSYVLVNEDTKIDLGFKKIYHNNEEKMSLTQLTIDGNENIEIIPNEEDGGSGSGSGNGDNEGTGSGGGSGAGEGTGTGTGSGSGDGTGSGDGDGSGSGDGTGTGTGSGTGSGTGDGDGSGSGDGTGEGTGDGTGSGGGGGSYERRANVELIEAKVEADSINAKFYLNDPDQTVELSELVVYITNTDTGERVYSSAVSTLPITPINENQIEFSVSKLGLAPETNYIISVNKEKNGKYDTQYFQKLFKTDGLGIRLEKKYATSDSLAYEVIFDKETEVKSVNLTIQDSNYNDVQPFMVLDNENNIAIFEGLTSNTTYNIVLDNVILDNLEYKDTYKIYRTGVTLKNTPSISGLTSEANEENQEFTIGIDNIDDEHNSITKYYYHIYNADELTFENRDTLEPVLIISKNDASKVKVKIDGEKIKSKVNYKFKVVAEYYDNEKYVEYETELSESFILAERPYVKWKMDHNNSTFNRIAGTVVIVDQNCTIPIAGRECSSVEKYKNKFKMIYYDKENQAQQTIVDSLNFKLVVDEEFNKEYELKEGTETLQAYIDVNGLKANKTYLFDVYGDVDLRNNVKPTVIEGYHIGSFEANTNGVDILTVDTWVQNETGVEDLINVTSKIISTNANHNLANSLKYLTFNLYEGDVKDAINAGTNKKLPIATKELSGTLKDEYYNTLFTINTKDTFGFVDTEVETEEGMVFTRAIDLLKKKTNGKLPEYYTIEITNAHDGMGNVILIENNVYTFVTPPPIRIEENEINPIIYADEILNENLITSADTNVDSECLLPEVLPEEQIYEKTYNRDLSCSTKVGYKVDIQANINTLKKYFSDVYELIYYVCDASINSNCSIDNAIEKRVINLKETDVTETIFYLENGTHFSTKDTVLTRGHNYIFKAKFNVSYGKADEYNNIVEIKTLYPVKNVETEIKETPKQGATYSIYIDKTTENEVYYKYSFNDVDKTLYDDKFYYSVDGQEKQVYEFSEDPFVISGLTNDSVYEISFKRALIKTEKNIEESKVGKYIFDGKYTYSEDTINFENVTYDNDNRLRVFILENEINKSLVDRVSAYQITLSAEEVDDYVRVYPSNALKTCKKDDVEYRCIIIDYANIKQFKAKDTKVKITAYYDSGIVNNDFANISKSDIGYILQNNSIYNPDKIKGKYIYINESKGISTTELPYGIYEYSGNTNKLIQIERKIDLRNFVFKNEVVKQSSLTYANDSIYIKDSGGNNISINNKLLSKVDLGASDSSFRFNSYIPKIEVTQKELVNGSRITIKPTGLDNDILKNEFKEEDGKYYYYLKIYNIEEVETETPEGEIIVETKNKLYKTEKIEINPTESVIELTKYMPNTKYYFEVYAYMLKNKDYKETLLFDANDTAEYTTALYEFNTLSKDGINSITPYYIQHESYTDDTDLENIIYSKRKLIFSANTKQDIGKYDIKFQLIDPEGIVVYDEITTPVSSQYLSYDESKVTKDITDDDLVFGNGYYTLKIYILTEVYDSEEKAELLIYDSLVNLKRLSDPVIAVEKNEGVNTLSFNVNITDNDKVIKNGKYCVELLDKSGNALLGHEKKCDLSVLSHGESINFDGLIPDTLYIFRVYADIYTNNVGVTEKERVIQSRTVLSTSTEYGVALGSVAAYGTSSSVTLSFSSGVNVQNIKKINYSLMKQGGEEIVSEEFIMGENKNFIVTPENIRLIIEPAGLVLPKNSYIVVVYWVEKEDEEGNKILVKLNDKDYDYSIEF